MANNYGKIIKSDFIAPQWARNRHLQTIWPRYAIKRAKPHYTQERLWLPDGDFVDLAWGAKPAHTKAIIVLFHGLEGSIESHYAQDMMNTLSQGHWQVVLMHFRGCSGEPNLTPRAYHSGETSDPLFLLQTLAERYPGLPIAAVGFSLGGNMLLNLLAEHQDQGKLKAAVVVSAPIKLAECAKSINQGFAKVYQNHLLKSMKAALISKMHRVDYTNLAISEPRVRSLSNFFQFDDAVTAPLHGFAGVDDYYQQCSAFYKLRTITCPSLILHSKDDPFMNQNVIPEERDLSPAITYELSDHGGHVGFMQGLIHQPTCWLPQRVKRFLTAYLP